MKKTALCNLGCKVNAYETDAMRQLLEEAGYEIVPFEEKADIYIINTCTVTNIADRKSRQMLHRAKKNNPQAIVIAAGCYVQVAGEQAKKDSCIDVLVGNNRKRDIVKIIQEYEQEKRNEACIDIAKDRTYESLSISKTGEHTRAYVKIQDGCNQFCSYCMIPYARGRVRSRPLPEIVEEVKRLAANGYRETVLTGIHVSSYGTDFPDTDENLLSLLQELNAVEGLDRIRLSSMEPTIMTEEFISAISGLEKLCPHFHLSLQSGCDETLKRMNRHYNTKQYADCCELLRKYFDRPALTTDVIVGFPGETEEEFRQTKDFLEQILFYETHIFKYSRRKGTKADAMDNQIPEKIKAARSRELLERNAVHSKMFREGIIGEKREILLEESIDVNGRTYQTGFTKEYVKAAVENAQDSLHNMYSGTIEGFLTDEILLIR